MRITKLSFFVASALLAVLSVVTSARSGQIVCATSDYKTTPGLIAEQTGNGLTLTWDGNRDQEVRMSLIIDNGTPTIQQLAIRRKGGTWATVASNAAPEFRVVSGYRRLDQEQLPALQASKGEVTQDILDHYKWDAFWDAPLRVPGNEPAHGGSTPPPEGIPGTNQPGLPRKPEEIKRAIASFHANACTVTTNGQRLEVSYPGVEMGIFSGSLQYTVYKGTNLIRQEVIAKTDQDSVAYKYDAGLKGITIQGSSKVVWRDTSYTWQDYAFESPVNHDPSTVRAANRLIAIESASGSIAVFPPPHTPFLDTRNLRKPGLQLVSQGQ